MFRAQQNPFDEAVAKATDENLTSENWEYIMDVCDKVTGEESGAKDVVASLIKRLAHRNANVQLYTLELANALSQNCGLKMHRELASRAFTDALLRLAADRNSHQQVKAKILERMQEWADMFNDPDLGIMKDQFNRLKTQNPNLHPPSAPGKSRLTDLDRQKEDEELQMALKLSIQDKGEAAEDPGRAGGASSGAGQRVGTDTVPSQQAGPQGQTLSSGTTAATVSRVRALFDFNGTDADELTFRKGDIIAVLESVYKDWWKGLLRGQTGIFPLNYVEKLADPTPEELERESMMEAEVFAEIKNVEKLLTLLSTSTNDLNVRDNEEITKLYHSTLAIRPKLIELIGKYSQRKDDFTQLNERFIKSCRDYESLLDASMTQNQAGHQYGRPPTGQGYHSYPPQQDQRYQSPPPQNVQRPLSTPYLPTEQSTGPSQPYHQAPYPVSATTATGPRLPLGAPSPAQYQIPQSTPQTGQPPSSTHNHPQELATSAYSSPVNVQPASQPHAPSAPYYANEESYATAPPSGPAPSSPPNQGQQYKPYAPFAPSAPSGPSAPDAGYATARYDSPAPTSLSNSNAPVPSILAAGDGAPTGAPAYQAYQPNTSNSRNPSDPQDFYR